MQKTRTLITAALLGGLSLSLQAAPGEREVLIHYADIAQAMYEDALDAARGLQGAVHLLTREPTAEHLAAARSAWRTASYNFV